MKDGVHLITCSRPGCNKELGAVKVEGGVITMSEWARPNTYDKDKNEWYCEECASKMSTFVTPEEIEDDDA